MQDGLAILRTLLHFAYIAAGIGDASII